MAIEARCIAEGNPALPIHDGFVTREGREAERVMAIMDEQLERVLATIWNTGLF